MTMYESNAVRQQSAIGGIATASPPSLEQRLDHLTRGVERAQKLRAHLGTIAERAGVDTRPGIPDGRASGPPSQDLSGRFGDSIGHLHANLDEIEALAIRIERTLFDAQPAPLEKAR